MSAVAATQPAAKPDIWNDVMAFARECGAGMYDRWPDSILKEYFLFHAGHRQLAFDCDAQGHVCALAIGFRTPLARIEEHWHPGDPAGDCFYFQVLIVRPGHTDSLTRLVAWWLEHYPEAAKLRFFSRRKRSRRLQSYSLAALRRLARPKERWTPHLHD